MTKQDIIYILILLLVVSIGFLAYNTITAKEKIQTRNNIISEKNIELLANQDLIEELTEENYNLQQSNENLRKDSTQIRKLMTKLENAIKTVEDNTNTLNSIKKQTDNYHDEGLDKLDMILQEVTE